MKLAIQGIFPTLIYIW